MAELNIRNLRDLYEWDPEDREHRIPTSNQQLRITKRNELPEFGSSARWGAFAGIMGLFLVSQVPIIKKSILQKTPVVGWYWKVEEDEKK
ncbi:hypothetical protein H4217_002343 [Coemansia sp. RSA 1939]|nr:hypothetical protein H4217_002343 [Coemansia sp. RSA 1939]